MSLPKKRVNVFIVSDATGITAEMVVSAALVQFRQIEPMFKKFPYVKTKEQITDILDSAGRLDALVIYSIVSPELKKYFRHYRKSKNVNAIDLLGPILKRMERRWNMIPVFRPGIFKGIRDESTSLAESIDFTMRHDDGQGIATLEEADLILLGISRTSKTPTSLYLSCNYNLKVANFPIIPGEQPPEKIFSLQKRKVGFVITPHQAAFFRQKRFSYLEQTDYTDMKSIKKELQYSQNIFRKIKGLQVIDVTYSSIEEIASEIMEGTRY